MKLTFTKDFPTQDCTVCPITMDGEFIECVISCKVESHADAMSTMTLTVLVRETFADQAARRLKGNNIP